MSVDEEQTSRDRGELDGTNVSQPVTEDTEQKSEESGPLRSKALQTADTVPQTSQQAECCDPFVESAGSAERASVDGTIGDNQPNQAPPDFEGSNTDESSRTADKQVLAASRQRTRRSFLGASAAVVAGYGFYHHLASAPSENMQPTPLEKAYTFSAAVSRAILDGDSLAPTYQVSRAETLRINGIYGLKKDIVPESWRLQVVGAKAAERHPRFVPDVTAWEYEYRTPAAHTDVGHDTKVDPNKEASTQPGSGRTSLKPPDEEIMSSIRMAPASMLQQAMTKEAGREEVGYEDDNHTGRKRRGLEEAGESDSTLPPHTPGLLLQLQDISCLPRTELVTQFKCIEGWSQIVHWAGVRMADFLQLYPPALINGREPRYVYMETPDGDYYTGFDFRIMRHPQTLLVTEMMGAPLTQKHGAPLRLHMPTKYGYKQIKRIGLIAYTDTQPDDYWTKLGYDWYAGL